jgi:hypothetical protein
VIQCEACGSWNPVSLDTTRYWCSTECYNSQFEDEVESRPLES